MLKPQKQAEGHVGGRHPTEQGGEAPLPSESELQEEEENPL